MANLLIDPKQITMKPSAGAMQSEPAHQQRRRAKSPADLVAKIAIFESVSARVCARP